MLEHMFERVNPPERHDFRHCRRSPGRGRAASQLPGPRERRMCFNSPHDRGRVVLGGPPGPPLRPAL